MQSRRKFLVSSLLLSLSAQATELAMPDLPRRAIPDRALGRRHGHPSQMSGRSTPDMHTPVKWLLSAQHESGGWGPEAKAQPDVATTAIAAIALMRLHTEQDAPARHQAVMRAAAYISGAVERTAPSELSIERPGTQPQAKLGRNVDTYVAAQFLAELLPSLSPGNERSRISNALERCVAKIQSAQRGNGSFSADGWAPVLSSAFASNGLYAAKRAGSAGVKAEALERSDRYMLESYDEKKKEFKTEDAAGIPLYQAASALGSAGQSGKLSAAPAKAAMRQLEDEAFVRGFGTYGGEEHVSYMLSTEAIAKAGGKNWDKWHQVISTKLANIQRQDGLWRGDHCITSTVFCTAASIITLAIKPVASKKVQQG